MMENQTQGGSLQPRELLDTSQFATECPVQSSPGKPDQNLNIHSEVIVTRCHLSRWQTHSFPGKEGGKILAKIAQGCGWKDSIIREHV